jgi:hypothetical protein
MRNSRKRHTSDKKLSPAYLSLSLVCISVIYCYALAVAQSLESAATPKAGAVPVSPIHKMLSAKTVYLVADAAGEQPPIATGPVPESLSKPLAHEELTKAMRKWGRFEIVTEASRADLVLLVVEWEDYHRWGRTIVCRDQLFVYEGGALPTGKSQPLWRGDPEQWGKWGGCSGAGQPIKELRKEIEKADKASR